MAANSSTGETASNYLEKVTHKDLVMFSPATRKQIAKVIIHLYNQIIKSTNNIII